MARRRRRRPCTCTASSVRGGPSREGCTLASSGGAGSAPRGCSAGESSAPVPSSTSLSSNVTSAARERREDRVRLAPDAERPRRASGSGAGSVPISSAGAARRGSVASAVSCSARSAC
eukprot:2910406-Pyramimonas_sp.AAC.1